MLLLCQRFRSLYAREPTPIEIKHQRLQDIIQASINQNTYKNFKNFAPSSSGPPSQSSQSGLTMATKSIRSLLTKNIEQATANAATTQANGGSSTGTISSRRRPLPGSATSETGLNRSFTNRTRALRSNRDKTNVNDTSMVEGDNDS